VVDIRSCRQEGLRTLLVVRIFNIRNQALSPYTAGEESRWGRDSQARRGRQFRRIGQRVHILRQHQALRQLSDRPREVLRAAGLASLVADSEDKLLAAACIERV